MAQTGSFKKVLIANRGAIATRIIRTLRRLGIVSVAVFAESDRHSLHVLNSDESYSLGDGDALSTYLDVNAILDIAKEAGVQAIHPGYGFLSENSEFSRACKEAGIVFIGPEADHIDQFGLKHHARLLATNAGLPLLSGSELLVDEVDAVECARKMGYPVMLKSTAGGGGIGLMCCYSDEELRTGFDAVKRLSQNNFANSGVFVEKYISKARHIEVQVFADGAGNALAIGERDCSSQRRNQKVIEECPAPNISDDLRAALHAHSENLLASVAYRNIATVEYILDADTQEYFFLEVNTRLQVEHGVTEMVYGIDLVEWMLEGAAGVIDLAHRRLQLSPVGHAIQARLYAEDPYKNFQPSAGLLSECEFPDAEGVRVDHWITAGVEIPDCFDPMLGKLIVHANDRPAALAKLAVSLKQTRLYGVETNIEYLCALVSDTRLEQGLVTTAYLNEFEFHSCRIDVLRGGTQTTLQDAPGRIGYWNVGVPPSGPFDNYSFRLGNRLLGNESGVVGLEIAHQGPSLRFSVATQFVLSGAEVEAALEGQCVPMWTVVDVDAGQVLDIGRVSNEGARVYLAVAGGVYCQQYLGSSATFTLGQFGGHNGRALQAGDVLKLTAPESLTENRYLPDSLLPQMTHNWQLRVIYGPHGAPDFFTKDDIQTFVSTHWEVHYNSSRTGVRLIGPKPSWARENGGEAGLHPSNIHDNAYAFGSVDFTGDMPIILGPDGPSLGGFVCPATVITADLWKIGQVRAGDKIQFVVVSVEDAVQAEKDQLQCIQTMTVNAAEVSEISVNTRTQQESVVSDEIPDLVHSPVVMQLSASDFGENVVYRVAGDHFLLIEYGDAVLDIALRFRVHALMQWIENNSQAGVRELTPGIRSLQVHYDSQVIGLNRLLDYLRQAETQIRDEISTISVDSRIVHLPLSWDDPACQQAIDKYSQSVRPNAPWCPSNLEFIRRINGLESIDEVKRIVFDASYLVMGLGDVYLGAPVATPLNPCHRLVTTKYNPARTWTAENSVGIGGSYMCVYGMEGPGGYQFVGRTLQMWNRYKETPEFDKPWLLRFFDQIRYYEVTADELLRIRQDFPVGKYPLKIEKTSFNMNEYNAFLKSQRSHSEQFKNTRSKAFDEELSLWHRTDQFNYAEEDHEVVEVNAQWSEESVLVESSVAGRVWEVVVQNGASVLEGQTLVVIESMKMEFSILSPCNGTVTHVLSESGKRVSAGQVLVVIEEQL